MNIFFAIDYQSRAEAERGLAEARRLQRAGRERSTGLTILDAAPAQADDHEGPDGERASILVLAADTGEEAAIIAALGALGGTIRHAAIAPYAGSHIREGAGGRPARAEPEVADAVASLDRG